MALSMYVCISPSIFVYFHMFGILVFVASAVLECVAAAGRWHQSKFVTALPLTSFHDKLFPVNQNLKMQLRLSIKSLICNLKNWKAQRSIPQIQSQGYDNFKLVYHWIYTSPLTIFHSKLLVVNQNFKSQLKLSIKSLNCNWENSKSSTANGRLSIKTLQL